MYNNKLYFPKNIKKLIKVLKISLELILLNH